MGAYSSQLVPQESKIISQSLKPTSPDWIIAHVDACNVTIIKVQRCWHRFQQMGCNKNGNLTAKSKVWSTETNKFLQQVLRQLPWNEQGILTFESYVNACAWFESSSLETKAKVVYGLMNRGNPVDTNLLQRILTHVYKGQGQDKIAEFAQLFMKQIDTKNQGTFDEGDFLQWINKIPLSTAENVFQFEIFPSSTRDEIYGTGTK